MIIIWISEIFQINSGSFEVKSLITKQFTARAGTSSIGLFCFYGTMSGQSSVLLVRFDLSSKTYLSNLALEGIGTGQALASETDETSYLIVFSEPKIMLIKVSIILPQ